MKSIVKRLRRFFFCLGQPLQKQGVMLIFLGVLSLTMAWNTGRPSHSWWHFAMCWWGDAYLLVSLLTLFPRPLRRLLKMGVYIGSYSLWAVEIFLFERFLLCISPTVLQLLAETTPAESSEFIEGIFSNHLFWKTIALTFGLILLNVLMEYRKFLIPKSASYLLSFTTSSRTLGKIGRGLRTFSLVRWHMESKKYVVSSLATLLLVCALPAWTAEKAMLWQFLQNDQSEHVENMPESHFFTSFYRTLQAWHLVRIAAHETDALIARMEQLPPMEVPDSACPNIVVIIGESYNKHHAALYGYPLPTTPRLSQRAERGELLVFDNVVSPWNITSNAFRAFLSTHSEGDAGRWNQGVLFPSLFKRAGYKVVFLSNQFFHTAAQGSIDFNGSFFLNDSRVERLCFDHRNKFRSKNDGNILSLLRGFSPSARNLYVFHLWGQHMEYAHRYPSDRERFTFHDINRTDLNEAQQRIVAHYDNATRWNDEAVDRIIRHYEKEDAVVIYFSDHGEEVFDEGVKTYGRIHDENPTLAVIRHEYEVPFMVWGSERFRRNHFELFTRIKAARQRPFSHDDLPHLLLGLSGISTPYYSAERDLFSPQFRPHPRLLRGHLDYDKAMNTPSPQ